MVGMVLLLPADRIGPRIHISALELKEHESESELNDTNITSDSK